MGLSSSQARLLHLTGRMHQIEYKAQKLEAQKLQLANESSRVYEEYENALDATKIQYNTLNSDGSTTYVDATLNALENKFVKDYDGLTSNNSFLLYDGENGVVKVTPSFAQQYGITGGKVEDPGTLETYLTAHGCYKDNVPDTYTIDNGLSNVENVQTGSTYYSSTGTAPSVSAVNPSTTPITDYSQILKTSDANKTYTVSSAEELNKLATLVNSGAETDGVTIVLTNNINIPSSFASISNFNGTFNGNGYTISGLNDSLFTTLGNGATVTNLGIDNANINKSGTANVGALAGSASGATISNIKVTNSTVSGSEKVGGLVGSADNGTNISKCSVDVTVTASGKDVGGMLGYGDNVTVNSCSGAGNITGLARIGGLIGNATNSTISQSKVNNISVTSTSTNGTAADSGGFIGSGYTSTISNCEAQGSVSCPSNSWSVGGFAGSKGARQNKDAIVIDNCYSDVTVTVPGYSYQHGTACGSFIGDGGGATISNCETTQGDCFTGQSNSDTTITNSYSPVAITYRNGAIGSVTQSSIHISTAGAKSYQAPTLAHNATPAAGKSTEVKNISTNQPVVGSLTVNGSDDELRQYIAFKVGGANNYADSYNAIKGQYTTAQLAELLELANSGRYSSMSDLTSALTNKYNATDYPLTQNDTITYSVTENHNADIKSAEVSSADDTAKRLAYDIWTKNGSGDVNTIKSQILSSFNNNQLASLTYYYGKPEWATIVNALSNSIDASAVSAYTNRYDSTWTINQKASNVNITAVHHEPVWHEDENYFTQVENYNNLKAMQGYNFEIVDEKYCNSSEFVTNWLTAGGAHLLRFDGSTLKPAKMEGTNVSVETSLREVNDEKNLKKAEAKYEADMKRIDLKDRKYDTDLAAMETERNAIKEEMETLKTVAKDNVERTFKLFS